MSITVYKANKHRILSGKKIYKNGAWITLPSNAKMWLNGAWHKLGFPAGSTVIPAPVIPDAPPMQTITHDNGTEPATGTKWYITPEGNGLMDGSSWANAASASMVHVILLQCTSGDSVCFAAGAYASDRVIALPAGVNLYGGFDTSDPAWATRNGFASPTVFTGDGTFAWLSGSSATSGQVIDGISVTNYSAGIVNGGNLKVRNAVFTSAPATVNVAEYCVFSSSVLTAATASYVNIVDANCMLSGATADHINVYGTTGVIATMSNAAISNSTFVHANLNASTASYCDVYYGRCTLSGATADHINVYGTASNVVTVSMSNAAISNSTFVYADLTASTASYCDVYYGNCTTNNTSGMSASHVSIYGTSDNRVTVSLKNAENCSVFYGRSSSSIFGGTATSCNAVNCASPGSIFGGTATSCNAVNCTSSGSSSSYIFSSTATNCTAVNCTSSGSSSSSIFGGTATSCNAVNCTSSSGNSSGFIFRSTATNCAAVNCSCPSTSYIFCISNTSNTVKNCISWNNNSGTEFNSSRTLTTCAGSVYDSRLALTLGTDNSIARFTNTGYYPAQGVQDVGACPSPIDDPTGYADYLAAFGDWHPLANSFLVGRGTADSNVTDDADGVTRPDPPTIGAYEPVPAAQE